MRNDIKNEYCLVETEPTMGITSKCMYLVRHRTQDRIRNEYFLLENLSTTEFNSKCTCVTLATL